MEKKVRPRLRKLRVLDEILSADHALTGGIFMFMQVAEEEIEWAVRCWPSSASALNAAFRYLLPSPVLRPKGQDLYRDHVRELLRRVAKGGDIRLGTRAEMLATLSETSLRAPLTPSAAGLFDKLFRDIYGNKVVPGKPLSGERYEGEWKEEEAAMRRKLSRDREEKRRLGDDVAKSH